MKREIYQKVAGEFERKRQAALLDAAGRKAALYAACPALSDLDGKAAALSLEKLRRGEMPEYEAEMKKVSDRRAELVAAAGSPDILPHFDCPICEDTGRVPGGYCKCFQRRVIEENLAAANLSADASRETFETFDLARYSDCIDAVLKTSPRAQMKMIYNNCRKFADTIDDPGKNLLLIGQPGLGKTHLSSAIAAKVLEGGHTVAYISASEFASRAAANKFSEAPEMMEPLYEADLLILDDLGTEFRTAMTCAAFGDLLDRRLRQGKKMVFSSNLNMSEIANFYGERVASRLKGYFVYLVFLGTDQRGWKG